MNILCWRCGSGSWELSNVLHSRMQQIIKLLSHTMYVVNLALMLQFFVANKSQSTCHFYKFIWIFICHIINPFDDFFSGTLPNWRNKNDTISNNTRASQNHHWKPRQNSNSYEQGFQILGAFQASSGMGKIVFLTNVFDWKPLQYSLYVPYFLI